MRRFGTFIGRALATIGGIGYVIKGVAWFIDKVGTAETATDIFRRRVQIVKFIVSVSQFWPLGLFLLGVFILACIRFGSPQAWFAAAKSYLPYKPEHPATKQQQRGIVLDDGEDAVISRNKIRNVDGSAIEVSNYKRHLFVDNDIDPHAGRYDAGARQASITRHTVLRKMLNQGYGHLECFSIEFPQKEIVDNWWARCVDAASVEGLREYVSLRDVIRLKELEVDEGPGLRLMAQAADRGEEWTKWVDRIQLYLETWKRTESLKRLLAKIEKGIDA